MSHHGSWDPWNELNRLQDELNRLFSGATRGARDSGGYPNVNVWVHDDGAQVVADLPGVDPDGVDISVMSESVTLRGKREADTLAEGHTAHKTERFHGSFSRTVDLPFRVDPERVEASYDKGVLKVSLPRARDERARRVKVNRG